MGEASAEYTDAMATARQTVAAPSGGLEPSQRRLFAAFAGGGAKGLVHVGALAALETRYLRIVGFSGTSAGAIVAALAAAGFTAEEIIHPTEPRSILDLLQRFDSSLRRPVDLFGPGGWAEIVLFRTLARLFTLPRIAVAAGLLAVAMISTVYGAARHGFGLATFALVMWVIVTLAAAALVLRALIGLTRLDTLRTALSQVLSEKLFPGVPQRVVRMKDFDGRERPSLKIVAADLTSRRLELFSCDTTPEVAVADAVAASICLPVIFRPWPLDFSRYVDGGIVSNIPAWPFDEERQLDPEAITVAFEIGSPLTEDDPRRPPGALGWGPALIDTTLSGAAKLSLRAVGLAELITFRPTLSLMDFDLSPERTREELRNATAFAAAEIDRRLFSYPETYERACAEAVRLTEIFLEAAGIVQSGQRTGRVRVGVALPTDDFRHSLRLRYGWNFNDDPDQNIILPLQGSIAGEAWSRRRYRFYRVPFPPSVSLAGDDRRALRRFFWRDLAWSLCVPILGRDGEPRCVVTVDGSDILTDTTETRVAFRGLAGEMSNIFTPMVWRLLE